MILFFWQNFGDKLNEFLLIPKVNKYKQIDVINCNIILHYDSTKWKRILAFGGVHVLTWTYIYRANITQISKLIYYWLVANIWTGHATQLISYMIQSNSDNQVHNWLLWWNYQINHHQHAEIINIIWHSWQRHSFNSMPGTNTTDL